MGVDGGVVVVGVVAIIQLYSNKSKKNKIFMNFFV